MLVAVAMSFLAGLLVGRYAVPGAYVSDIQFHILFMSKYDCFIALGKFWHMVATLHGTV